MPQLNSRQFRQDVIPGFHTPEITPGSLGRANPPTSSMGERYDPGSDTKRGTVGEGQRMLNFDAPDFPLETSRAGLVPVTSDVDPTWDRSAWRLGGINRQMMQDAVDVGEVDESSEEFAVTRGWENAPVETIGPDAEIRTAQAGPGYDPDRRGDPFLQVDVMDDHVEELRDAGESAFTDPESGEDAFPWVAELEGKRYLLEGHHRAVAARTRDDGEFPAHVLRGANWSQIEDQLYDGPRR